MSVPKQSWQRVTELFEQALERAPQQRGEFLKSACADDADLLQEVESLLAAHEAEDDFLESPAIASVADQIAGDNGHLRIGQQLGQYRIDGLLGAGGMGEVYVARDRLGRDIALKLLTQKFPGDKSGVARFQQEARTLLALNHPHIVTIHDIDQSEGVYYIASELVEGETLRQRLDKNDVRLEELLDISIQVATALAAAHEKGIIHRDIKPENVMIRRDGFVKVLDFGIAKLTDSEWPAESGAPVLKQTDTAAGTIVGTAPYMSPEQARGLNVDARTDIWSLGVVIYEAVAGRKPFSGETTPQIIDAVIHKTWAPLKPHEMNLPKGLERVVSRALQKEKEARYRTAGELLTDLKELTKQIEFAKLTGEITGDAVISSRVTASDVRTTHFSTADYLVTGIKRHRLVFAVSLLALLVGIVWLALYLSRGKTIVASESVPFSEMNISRLTSSGKSTHAAISPDGKYLAHVTNDAEGESLWVRQAGAPSELRISGPAETEYLWVAFAPDGNWIYYVTLDRDKGDTNLYRVSAQGGPATMAGYDVWPVGFSPNHKEMAFVRVNHDDSYLVIANPDSTNQRALAKLQHPDFFRGEWNAPAWSPDGKTIACPVRLTDKHGEFETILGIDVKDGAQRQLTAGRWSSVDQPAWLADGTGVLLTARERSTAPRQVWHIDIKSGEATRVTHDLNDYHDLTLTQDSSKLAVVQAHEVSNIWMAREADSANGRQIVSEIGPIDLLAWTPDARIVYRSNAGESSEIWTANADGTARKQLTTGARISGGLTVSPDGRYIFFVSDRAGHFNIWRVDADGQNLKQMTTGDSEFYPQCSPDGEWVFYQQGYYEPRLWKMRTDGSSQVQLTATRASRPAVSRDGQMIAYHYLDPDVEKSQWAIGVVSLEGVRLLRFGLPPTVAPSPRFVRWAPDHKSVAYVNKSGGVADIWVQPLDGSPPKQLTSFKAEQILAFDWSPDGRSLAFVRNVETSDVVLIEQGKNGR